MYKPFLVWNPNHQLGDVVIASFADEKDAIFFAQQKANRAGGWEWNLLVGVSFENRKPVSEILNEFQQVLDVD